MSENIGSQLNKPWDLKTIYTINISLSTNLGPFVELLNLMLVGQNSAEPRPVVL